MVQTVTKPGKYFDGHGLYLRVDPTGGKFWVQRIVINGKRCELGMGSVDFVTLADARGAAFGNRKLAREGGDPLAARRSAQEVMTFEEAARQVHEINLPTWKNPKHGDQFLNTLATYAFPIIGNTRAPDVTTADVLAVLQPIWLEKAETARRVKQRIGTVMKWCIAKGWRKDNPVDAVDKGLPKQTTKKEHRKSLPTPKLRPASM
nr:integrase arm-type DNA-binding domain-containing protein [Paracoccus sp. IB05]